MNISSRKRLILRRTAIAVAALSLVGCLFANYAARLILIQQVRALTGLHADVDSVRLSPTAIVIRNFRLLNGTDRQNPLLSVAEIRVALTVADGLRSGRWADSVDIRQPTLRMEFSKSGELLTAVPQFRSTDANDSLTIPVRSVNIRDARLVVQQHEGGTIDLPKIQMAARCGETVVLAVTAPALFEADWTVRGEFDPRTLSGSVAVVGKEFRITSSALRQLPLMPASVPKDISCAGSLKANLTIPPDLVDLRDAFADLKIEFTSLDALPIGIESANGVVRCSQRDGAIALEGSLSLMDGNVVVVGRSDLRSTSPSGDLQWQLQNVQLNPLCRKLSLPGHGLLNADGRLFASIASDQITFRSTGRSNVSGIRVFDIPIEPFDALLSANGRLDKIKGTLQPIDGEIRFSARSAGVAVADVATRLSQLASSNGTELPPELAERLQTLDARGRISFVAESHVPLAALKRPELVSGSAQVLCDSVATSDFTLQNCVARLDVSGGMARFNFADVRLFHVATGDSAAIDCRGTIPLNGAGNAGLQFQMSEFPLSFPSSLIGLQRSEVNGNVSAVATVTAPANRILRPESFVGEGYVSAPLVAIFGEQASNVLLRWSLAESRLSINQAGGQTGSTVLTGQAHIDIVRPWQFGAQMQLAAPELESVAQSASRLAQTNIHVRGSGGVNGSIQGDIASGQFALGGNLLLENFAINNSVAGRLEVDCYMTPVLLSVKSKPGQFFGGNLNARAALQNLTHVDRVVGRISGVQLSMLQWLPASAQSFPVGGEADGGFDFVNPLQPEHISGTARMSTRRLNVSGVAIDRFDADILAESGSMQTSVDASFIGAQCQATLKTYLPMLLQLSPEQLRDPQQLPLSGHASLSQLSISRIRVPLAQILGIKLPAELSGIVSGRIERTPTLPESGIVATGEASLKNLTWNRALLGNSLAARMRIMPDALDVHEISGTLADGRVEGRATLNLNERLDGTFRLSVARMNLKKAAAPLGRDAATVQGLAGIQIEGRLGRRLSGRANVTVDRAEVLGVSASHLSVPVQWTLTPAQRTLHVRTNSTSLDLGGGRVRCQGDMRWNGRLDMNATVNAQQVDTRRLLPGLPGGGIVSGSARLRGQNASSINDVTGQFQAEIKDVQALQMPVMQQASRFLGSISQATSFDDGIVSGRLGNGTITVDRMTLMASSIKIIIEGTSTLAGRLNLFVSAYTGQTGPADKLLSFAKSPIMLTASAPIALVANANEVLRDRTVHLHVTGDVKHPLVRLQPGRQLQQEVIQLLVQSAIPTGIPSVGRLGPTPR